LIELYEAATNEITPENNYESCQENFPNCSENTILDDFREWGEGQAQSPNFGSGFVSNPDVATFWTSRDIVDGFNILNIGYSHFEGICNDRGYNICEDAERYRGNEPMQMTLWAHELGHTWNAYHTNLDDTHMMNSNVTSVAVNVDPNTTSAIAQHKATRACLDNGPCNTCAGVTAQITGLPATTSSTAPIALIGNPPGGTFSGTGVVFNGFNPSIAGPGNHTITYNYDDGNGCTATATQDILVFTIIFNFVNYGLGTIAPKLVDVNIEFQLNEPDNFNFQIFNVQGQMIYRDKLQFESGYNIENFTVPQLQKGAYVARIFNDEFQVSKKFVVSD